MLRTFNEPIMNVCGPGLGSIPAINNSNATTDAVIEPFGFDRNILSTLTTMSRLIYFFSCFIRTSCTHVKLFARFLRRWLGLHHSHVMWSQAIVEEAQMTMFLWIDVHLRDVALRYKISYVQFKPAVLVKRCLSVSSEEAQVTTFPCVVTSSYRRKVLIDFSYLLMKVSLFLSITIQGERHCLGWVITALISMSISSVLI